MCVYQMHPLFDRKALSGLSSRDTEVEKNASRELERMTERVFESSRFNGTSPLDALLR
jgi:hypothetical protein